MAHYRTAHYRTVRTLAARPPAALCFFSMPSLHAEHPPAAGATGTEGKRFQETGQLNTTKVTAAATAVKTSRNRMLWHCLPPPTCRRFQPQLPAACQHFSQANAPIAQQPAGAICLQHAAKPEETTPATHSVRAAASDTPDRQPLTHAHSCRTQACWPALQQLPSPAAGYLLTCTRAGRTRSP